MLLRHSLADDSSAARIERAVDRAYADGLRTADVARSGAPVSTRAFTQGVLDRL
jgi:isocitrate dehydrogenase